MHDAIERENAERTLHRLRVDQLQQDRDAAQTGADLLGVIALAGRGQEAAVSAAVKWVRDHCPANDLELVRVENFNDRYPGKERAYFSLTRFTVARSESAALDGWALPTGLPPVASGATRRAANKRQKAA
ncbi:hypothetical protein [Streptomyces sp. NPDC054765]